MIALVLETSAFVAIGLQEPDAAVFTHRLQNMGGRVVLPASGYLEVMMVLTSQGVPRVWIDTFLSDSEITLHPISGIIARLAADAFERYGRGSGHPARLNFGDCLSYAVAIELDAPLLFKGQDFAHTDVKRAI